MGVGWGVGGGGGGMTQSRFKSLIPCLSLLGGVKTSENYFSVQFLLESNGQRASFTP